MSSGEFELNSSWKFREQTPQNNEAFEAFKNKINKILASQPKDGFSNARGPIAEAIPIPLIPMSDIRAFCEEGLPKTDRAAKFPDCTFFPIDKIGKLDETKPPFAVKVAADLTKGFIVPPDGEIVVNPTETVKSSDVAIVCLDGNICMKEVNITPSGFELVASKSQPPILVPGELFLFDRFKILGKVMGVIKPIR